MRGVNGHAEGLRVELEQGFLALGQVCCVLAQVLRRDHEQRLFVGVWVYRVFAGAFEFHAGCRAQPLAAKRRDSALGIARLLGADTGQILAQPGDLVGGCLGQERPAVTVQNQSD